MLVPYMGVVTGSIWEVLAKDAVQAFEMSMCNTQWKDHFKGSKERELSTHTHTHLMRAYYPLGSILEIRK